MSFVFVFYFPLWDSACFFACLTTAQPLRCLFRSPQTQLEECIFGMFAFEARGRPRRSFFLKCEFGTAPPCARARVFFNFFYSVRFKNLVQCAAACAPRGTTFPLLRMKQFDSVSVFDILTLAYPLPALVVEAMLGGGGATHFVVQF